MYTDVSEEHTGRCGCSFFLLVACFAYTAILNMEILGSSEASVNSYRITEHHIPEDATDKTKLAAVRVSSYLYGMSQRSPTVLKM
jgi:hypothetical protein